MINLFINEEDEITTVFTEGAELAYMEDLIALNYEGIEGVEYQCADGVFMFTSAESQKIIFKREGMTDINIEECHDDWLRVSTNTNKVYEEFIKTIDLEWEEIESLNFNDSNTFMEAVTAVETSQGTIRYVSNCLLKNGEVSVNTVMLH